MTVMSRLALGLVLALSVCMCSVKEDRGFCPSWLHFSSEVFPEGEWESMHLFAYRDGVQVLSEVFSYDSYMHEGFDFSLMPGPAHIAVVFGWPEEDVDGDVLRIPVGQMCPEAWGFDKKVIVEEDVDLDFVEPLRALYANVYVDVVGRSEGYPWHFMMEGNVDGYQLATLEPHVGDFSVAPFEIDVQHFLCRVPRQVDESLGLALYDNPVGTKAGEGERQYVFRVGEIVAEGGYDWNARVLDDIHVTFDYAASRFIITVNDWTKVLLMNDKYVI